MHGRFGVALLCGLLALGSAVAQPAPLPLSPAEKERLGIAPTAEVSLVSIHDDQSKAGGDKSLSTKDYDAHRDLTTIEMGNVAGNRFLWRLTFADTYDTHSVLHLYLDADGDRKTGRQNGTGTDVMLSHSDGQPMATWYKPDGTTTTGPAPWLVVSGKMVYIAADVDLRQVNGHSKFRMMVLSERLDPHVMVDMTAWFEADGPGVSERPKYRMDSDVTADEGFRPFRGLPSILALKEQRGNLAVSIRQAKLEGFREDTVTEYRGISTMRTGAAGSTVTYPITATGRYWLGVQLYDGPGEEKVRVDLNGRRLGVLTATADWNDLVLYGSTQPVDLKAGDTVTVRALTSSGTYRFEELLLLSQAPPAWQPKYELTQVAATPESLTCLTTWPAKVTYQVTRDGREETTVEKSLGQNHRLALMPGAAGTARLSAQTPDGRTLTAGPVRIPGDDEPGRPGRDAVRRQPVPLKLLNADCLPPEGWLVTSGVPVPRGQLYSPLRYRDELPNVRLLAGQRPVPVQAAVTGRWPDGSVKWVLLSFTARPADGERYVMEYGTEVQPAPAPAWDEQSTSLHRVGRLRLEGTTLGWDADGDGKLSPNEVVIGAERKSLVLTDAQGGRYAMTCDGQTFTSAGSEKVEQQWYGSHRDAQGRKLWSSEIELTMPRGVPAVRVQHTFVNDDESQVFSRVRSLSWLLGLTGTQPKIAADQVMDAPVGATLRQVEDNRFEFGLGTGTPTTGRRAAGWAAVQRGDQSLAVIPRDFWQHYPKGLAITPEGVRLDLLPDIQGVPYGTDFYDTKQPDHRLYLYFDQGAYKVKQGCSKRQELWLTFGIDPAKAAKAVQTPPFVVAAPEWYQQTRAFGDISVVGQPVYPAYEEAVSGGLDGYFAGRERNREYGLFNYGDWYGERGVNWGNIEYDTQHMCFTHFVRSGDFRWFLAGEQAERHNADVDTVWAGRDLGKVHIHCVGHVGGYLTQKLAEGISGGGFTPSHTWCEGHAEYYYLTGDRRALATARNIADAWGHKADLNYDYTNGRDSGWHLLFTCAVYELTGDPYYLNVARIIVDRVVERQTVDGGWQRMLVPGHCYCDPPRHRGEAGFMVGVLLSGLKAYHQLTADARVPEVMYRGSKYLIADMWVPEVNGFRYTSCPKSSAGTWSNIGLFEGMAYADRFHPDAEVQRVLRAGCDASLRSVSAFGKSISAQLRSAPRVLWDMERLAKADEARGVPVAVAPPEQTLGLGAGDEVTLDGGRSHDRGAGQLVAWVWDFGDGQRGEGRQTKHRYQKEGSYTVQLTVRDNDGLTSAATTRVTVAPAWVRRLDPQRALLVEAESFSAEGGGKVRIESRVANSGKMITGWHTDLGHWLEWRFNVAAAGRYRVILRYCTDSTDTRRKVELDGAVPRPDLASVAFPRTGGFSLGRDDWRFTLLGGEANPFTVPLAAGAHTLRLTNLGDGLGLDYLLLVPQE